MTYIENKLEEIVQVYPEFKKFYTFDLQHRAKNTQKSYLNGLAKIFSILQKYDAISYTKEDIGNLVSHEEFKTLSNKSKNYYLTFLRTYLKYHIEDEKTYEALEKCIPRYNEQDKELDINELISRDELDLILRNVSIKKRALFMVLYEGALRRSELVGIKYKNIKFIENGDNEYANLYIEKSKTKGRNIPLAESIPYLKEYFNDNNFQPEDKLFNYHVEYITLLCSNITEKLKKKYKSGKNKWEKDLHPHLFRHTRLSELAALQINESILRKIAGWTKDSGMAKIYIHLDDEDVRRAVLQHTGYEKVEKSKVKIFKPIECENCGTENPQQNAFCSKCGKIINPKKVVIDRVKEKEDIEQLKTGMNKLKQICRILYGMIQEEDKGIELNEDYKSFIEFIGKEIK